MSETMKHLQERITFLEEEVATFKRKEIEIPDQLARELILNFINKRKQDGKRATGTLDIHWALHLPCAQITSIMEQLEKEGVVHEED